MITPTPTGLYGPGDFGPEFVTIDDLLALFENAKAAQKIITRVYRVNSRVVGEELGTRQFLREAILDLAEDMDARANGWWRTTEGSDPLWNPPIEPADTVNADLATGGE